ncbi:hypothetical protein [Azospirillum endophyticum]
MRLVGVRIIEFGGLMVRFRHMKQFTGSGDAPGLSGVAANRP